MLTKEPYSSKREWGKSYHSNPDRGCHSDHFSTRLLFPKHHVFSEELQENTVINKNWASSLEVWQSVGCASGRAWQQETSHPFCLSSIFTGHPPERKLGVGQCNTPWHLWDKQLSSQILRASAVKMLICLLPSFLLQSSEKPEHFLFNNLRGPGLHYYYLLTDKGTYQ